MRRYTRFVALAVVAVAASATNAGDSFVLEDDSVRLEREPCVAVAQSGLTVFAWASGVPDGAQPLNGIRLRRFNRKGHELGTEFRIDVLPGDLARKPSIAFQPGSNRFVVVWEGGAEGEKLRRRIWARVFDGEGRPVGTEIRVDQIRSRHDYWGGLRDDFGGPKVSVAPSGDFVVVWRSNGRTSCDRFNISARRFSASGKPLSDEFIVNRDRRWSQINPDVGHDGAGNFVIVWKDGRWIGTDSEVSVLRGRVFERNGVEQGREFDLSPEGRLAAGPPDLAVTPDGSFFCAWADRSLGFHPQTLLVGSYYPEGWMIGAPIVIESEAFEPTHPKIALTGSGEFMVVWSDIAVDRLRSSVVVGQRFAFDGTPMGNAEAVSPASCRGGSSPSVSASMGGVGALAWEVGHPAGIRGRRFAVAGPATTLPTPGAGPGLAIRIASWRKELLDERRDVVDRISAADRIACQRSEASWTLPGLVKCLNEDDNIAVGSACARAVGAVAESPQEALGPLMTAFQDDELSDRVRAAAADVIGSFGDEALAAAPVLLEALGERPQMKRSEMAARALGRIGDPSGIELMTEVLERNWTPFWRGYVTGLAELIEHEKAYSALSEAKERCERLSRGRRRGRGENPDLGPLDAYIRKGMRSAGEADEATIERTVEHARFRFVNSRIGVFDSPVELNHLLWHEWLDERLAEFQKMMRYPRGPCGCAFTLAAGIADADPLEGRAPALMGGLLRDSEAVCRPGILRIIGGMGTRGAPMADELSNRLFEEDFFRLENFNALVAVDPEGAATVNAMQRLASDENPRTREAAVRAMIDVGPIAIQPASEQLTALLDDPNPEIHHLADRALDLIEAESEVCDQTRQPAVEPAGKPMPSVAPVAIPSPPLSSAEPPRAVRTPMSGYTGKPKKPD